MSKLAGGRLPTHTRRKGVILDIQAPGDATQRPWRDGPAFPAIFSREEQNCQALPIFLIHRTINIIKWMLFCATNFEMVFSAMITGIPQNAKEGWLDPHSGGRKRSQPVSCDEQYEVTPGASPPPSLAAGDPSWCQCHGKH